MGLSKVELRLQLKELRLTMTDAERTVNSRAIVERLKKAADWSAVTTVHYFEPLRELMEPDISGLITYLEDNYSGIQLFTPRKIGNTWEMVSVRNSAVPDKFDVIIVPMLGFDPKALHRIGYGGGYYDKFLATQPQAIKIGVCFESGKIEKMPIEMHDIELGKIITEQKVY